MYEVRTRNGEIIQLDFDAMTDVELSDLEMSVFLYKKEKKERDIQKSIDTIISCIEAEMKKCPALRNRTAITTEDEYSFDWLDVLNMIKDTE